MVLNQRLLLMMQPMPAALISTGCTHVNCWFRRIFNEDSESKNEGNSLAQPWPTCCFVRPGRYCRVLVLGTKALGEHLWSPGGHFYTETYPPVNNILIALAQGNISQFIPVLYHQLVWCTQQINPVFRVEYGKIGLPLSVHLKLHLRWLSDGFLKEEIK